jgi:RNA-directed DNA polymerase
MTSSCSDVSSLIGECADLKSYFDSITKDRLLMLIKQKVTDGRILALIEAFLEQKVMEEWTAPNL